MFDAAPYVVIDIMDLFYWGSGFIFCWEFMICYFYYSNIIIFSRPNL